MKSDFYVTHQRLWIFKCFYSYFNANLFAKRHLFQNKLIFFVKNDFFTEFRIKQVKCNPVHWLYSHRRMWHRLYRKTVLQNKYNSSEIVAHQTTLITPHTIRALNPNPLAQAHLISGGWYSPGGLTTLWTHVSNKIHVIAFHMNILFIF